MAQKQFTKITKATPVPALAKAPSGLAKKVEQIVTQQVVPRGKSVVQHAIDLLAEMKPSGPPEPKKPKYEDLPLVSVLPQRVMDEAIALMYEDVAIAEQVAAFNKRRGEIKGELAILSSTHEAVKDGMRHGRVVVYNNGWKSKWTLSRMLLLHNLVTPEQIKNSMQEGKKSLDLRVVDLDKRREKGDGDDESEEG